MLSKDKLLFENKLPNKVKRSLQYFRIIYCFLLDNFKSLFEYDKILRLKKKGKNK